MTLADYKYRDIIHRCFRCGYCKFPNNWIEVNNCPAYARYRLESYSTGGRLWLIRAWLQGEIEWSEHLAQIVYACATCKNCVEQCPLRFNVDIVDMIVAARAQMVENGEVPTRVKEFLENIQKQGNPYGSPASKRGDWAQGTGIGQYAGQEYLYYIGCEGSYDTRAKEMAKSLGMVLLKAGTSFGVLGNDERSDGNDVNKLGEQALFEMLAEENIKQFNQLGVQKIVTLSPHSYNALKNDYPALGGKFEVFHYTEILPSLLESHKLKPASSIKAKVTYHDPCFLGRWNKLYDAPRAVLSAIPGIEFIEMERTRQGALCCGGGGGNFYTDFLGGSESSPARLRVKEACETGANILAVACPNCLTMLEDAVKAEGLDQKLQVKDIAELVNEVCV